MTVKIITDSTAYLPKEQLESLDISVLSLSVVFGNEVFKEVSLSNDVFYEKMATTDQFPTSSQPTVSEIKDQFEAVIQKGNAVFAIFLSAQMSGTFDTACMVKNQLLETYPEAQIEVFDSMTNCMQLGLQVIAVAQHAQTGASLSQVLAVARQIQPCTRFIFAPDRLDHLRKGGRIGMAKSLLGNLLNLKPILTVKDGKTDVITTVRTRKKSIDQMVDLLSADAEQYGLNHVVVHHIHCFLEAKVLVDRLKADQEIEAQIVDIGPVIGVHVGPGAIGIAYQTKNPIK